MTATDALYVALASDLRAVLLTDDVRLVEAPTFPPQLNVLRIGPEYLPVAVGIDAGGEADDAPAFSYLVRADES